MKRCLLLPLVFLLGVLGASAQPYVHDAWLTGGVRADPARLQNGDVVNLSDQLITKAVIWLHVSQETEHSVVQIFTPSSRHFRIQAEPSEVCYRDNCDIFSETGMYVLIVQPFDEDDAGGPYFVRTFELITAGEESRSRTTIDVGSTNIDSDPGIQGTVETRDPDPIVTAAASDAGQAESTTLPPGSGTVIERRTKSWLDLYWTRFSNGTETIYAKRPGDTAWTRTQCLGVEDGVIDVDHLDCDFWAEFMHDDNYTASGPRCADNPGSTFSILYRISGRTLRLEVKCP